MDLGDPDQRAAWHTRLGRLVSGRRLICGVGPLAAWTDWVHVLAGVGAERPLVLTTGLGAGPVPAPEDAHVVTLVAEPQASMTDEVRALDRLVRDLPRQVRQAIDDYDPEHEARWCVGPFVKNSDIDGRRVLGGRPAAWAAVEDKMLAQEIWASVGYPQSPAAVAPVDPALLRAASHDLDLGHGVVWTGDARDGINGGGDFVRWVRSEQERADAVEFFGPRCDQVRVMPFLEGVPCSIHGIVLPTGTVALRPVELAILRAPTGRFVYGGLGTSWDPPGHDVGEMRELVRRTGEHLRHRVGFRGGFGIDGVLTQDGFRPTELNPRMSAGLTNLGRSVDFASFLLLQLNLVAGLDPGITVAELERWALSALDRHRLAKPLAMSDRRVVDEPRELALHWDGRMLRRADVVTSLTLLVAPSPVGTFARLDLGDGLPPGARIGPLNAALMRFLDDELGTGFGTVEAAPDVR